MRSNGLSWEKRGTITSNTRENGRMNSIVTFNPEREHIQTRKIKRTFRELSNQIHCSSKNSRKNQKEIQGIKEKQEELGKKINQSRSNLLILRSLGKES
jgi:hypothetical protein